jgi:hypothetical protein
MKILTTLFLTLLFASFGFAQTYLDSTLNRIRDASLHVEKLRTTYGANHPVLREAELKLEFLRQHLAETTNAPPTNAEINTNAQRIAEAASGYNDAEQRTIQIANDLRKIPSPKNPADKDHRAKLVAELRIQVSNSLKFRTQMRRAQLDEAAAEVSASRARLTQREKLATKIIERRVEELSNSNDVSWRKRIPSVSTVSTDDKDLPESSLRTYPIGSVIVPGFFEVNEVISEQSPSSKDLDTVTAASVEELLEHISSNCSSPMSMRFAQSRMQLLIRHTEEGHREIEQLLELLKVPSVDSIRLRIMRISTEYVSEGREEEMELLLSKETLTRLQVEDAGLMQADLNSQVSRSTEEFVIVPGQPSRWTSENIPLNFTARVLSDSGQLQLRVDQPLLEGSYGEERDKELRGKFYSIHARTSLRRLSRGCHSSRLRKFCLASDSGTDTQQGTGESRASRASKRSPIADELVRLAVSG